jgi:2-methylaconitate cis-trans-isomerase PrpF
LYHKQSQIDRNGRRNIHLCNPYISLHAGASTEIYFLAKDLLSVRACHDALLLSVARSPDLRQVDGIGDPHLLTSKAVVVSRSKRSGRDVDAVPRKVVANELKVDVASSSRNMLADVAPSGVGCGLLKAERLVTRFRLLTINHKRGFPMAVEELA